MRVYSSSFRDSFLRGSFFLIKRKTKGAREKKRDVSYRSLIRNRLWRQMNIDAFFPFQQLPAADDALRDAGFVTARNSFFNFSE